MDPKERRDGSPLLQRQEITATALHACFASAALSFRGDERRWTDASLSEELRHAAAEYVRSARDVGCAPEVMLPRLKALLRADGEISNPAMADRLASAVVSHAILAYYSNADGVGDAPLTNTTHAPERRTRAAGSPEAETRP